MLVGVGAKRVRDLFDKARKAAPAIIFIDEIDAVGRQRGAGLGGGHDEREQTLNQMLVEMDGFDTRTNIIIMAATNRPDILDPALLRPGRFDREIVVHTPDILAREEILKLHTKDKKFSPDINYKILAKNTSGFSGADLENLVNESILLATRKNKKIVMLEDLEVAMIKVSVGPEKKSKVVSQKTKKLTAYHEAGHAIVAKFLPSKDIIHQISIIPRNFAGGYTMYLPKEENDIGIQSKTEMLEEIISLLGGRVAEEIVLNDISTCASNDIERATKIARAMITKYGMSEKLNPVSYESESQSDVFLGRDYNTHKAYSDTTSNEIDTEIKELINKAYQSAKTILKDNIQKLHLIAEKLIEKEKIEGDEFNELMAK